MGLIDEFQDVKFSPCRKFRYERSRTWETGKPTLVFCGLNPASNRGTDNGKTAAKFKPYAERHGYGGYVSVNLWAFIGKPDELRAAAFPVGPENDGFLERAFTGRDVICMWGRDAANMQRPRDALALIRRAGGQSLALAVNRDGTPRHLLYMKLDTVPQPYSGGVRAVRHERESVAAQAGGHIPLVGV